MSIYHKIRPLLFKLDPEFAHGLVKFVLRFFRIPISARTKLVKSTPELYTEFSGLKFKTPIGLAAGFDKDAEIANQLGRLAFSAIETGTVTLKPQSGNPKPRIFRLEEDGAILNKMGFNSKGIHNFVHNIAKYELRDFVLGANIGINYNSTDKFADYMNVLVRLYPYVDYVTVNISSPNTPGLRNLQKIEELDKLLSQSSEHLIKLESLHQKKMPLFIKIAPDIKPDDIPKIAGTCLRFLDHLSGIIVSNTSLNRDLLPKKSQEQIKNIDGGGISGRPLFDLSTSVLADLYKHTDARLPLIASGGVFTGEDAYTKIKNGASFVQIYTAIIYEGLSVAADISEQLLALLKKDGYTNISQAVGTAIVKK